MHNIFRIQSEDSIMCGFYYIAFIEYIIAGTTLLDYTNLLSSNHYLLMTISTSKTSMTKENLNFDFRLKN